MTISRRNASHPISSHRSQEPFQRIRIRRGRRRELLERQIAREPLRGSIDRQQTAIPETTRVKSSGRLEVRSERRVR
jgi:hypothetical protein